MEEIPLINTASKSSRSLWDACKRQNAKLVRSILKKHPESLEVTEPDKSCGYHRTKNSCSPLCVAVSTENLEIVTLLLEAVRFI